jgi:hypothetical protein
MLEASLVTRVAPVNVLVSGLGALIALMARRPSVR